MIKELDNKLKEAFLEYKELLSNKDFGGAFEVLGEIQNILDNYDLSKSIFYDWFNKVNTELSMFPNYESVYIYIEERSNVIKQVVSIGSIFNTEEFLLMLTASIEIEMICNLLEKRGDDSLNDCAELNEDIKEVSLIQSNKSAFSSALSLIRKNSTLPTINYWSKS